jgi:hypothetical protein
LKPADPLSGIDICHSFGDRASLPVNGADRASHFAAHAFSHHWLVVSVIATASLRSGKQSRTLVQGEKRFWIASLRSQ